MLFRVPVRSARGLSRRGIVAWPDASPRKLAAPLENLGFVRACRISAGSPRRSIGRSTDKIVTGNRLQVLYTRPTFP